MVRKSVVSECKVNTFLLNTKDKKYVLQHKYAIFAKKNIMNKLIAYIFAALILFCVGAFIGVKIQKPEIKPTYTTNDSIAKDSLETSLDTIYITKTKVKERVRIVRETDTIIYKGNDTTCLEIIERKNNLIAGLDSLCDVLDKEAQTYSELNVLEIKRNKQLSFENDSIISNYKDSILNLKKTHKKRIFWNNVKCCAATTIGIYGAIQVSK